MVAYTKGLQQFSRWFFTYYFAGGEKNPKNHNIPDGLKSFQFLLWPRCNLFLNGVEKTHTIVGAPQVLKT